MGREREGDPSMFSEDVRLATRVTVEGVDLALLRQASRLLGAEDAAAVDQALAELIRDRNRRRAVTAELHRYESGQFAVLSGQGTGNRGQR
ncbi:hypothetical protein Kisp01_61970 [Kineosporia sp. NBRC 101677]|nr:hypothetical protein Kisp01_61970 [Kineosporia sp. NBRC 101677]